MTQNARQILSDWFSRRGWQPFPFQEAARDAYLAGQSGLVHAPTGTGKTVSVLLGPFAEALAKGRISHDTSDADPLTVLWVTPLRALAQDTVESIREVLFDLPVPWSVEKRTGDSSASVKERQRKAYPTVLVTTPESLSIMLSYSDSRRKLGSLRAVVVDEWHELLSTKRGVQTELCLARLRTWRPELRVWGLSATLGNLEQALAALLGAQAPDGCLIQGKQPREIRIETLFPPDLQKFPWAGHLGIGMAEPAAQEIEKARTTLFFCNTRNQAEMWFERLVSARPQWENRIALHHGSLDRATRNAVEEGLKTGKLLCAVATSSLDLGVDFSPVDQVMQLGSPKGIARMLQRAGRSGHQPGAVSRILCVPTNAFELVEFSAARGAAERREIEERPPLRKPLDVLAQHLLTIAIGKPFAEEAMLAEVRRTYCYAELTDEEWRWTLDFLSRGGPALRAYPDYARIGHKDGLWKPSTTKVVKNHRMMIGTITSDSSVMVKFQRGKEIGTVEESFVSRLKPGDHFLFGGKTLEFIRFQSNVAEVRLAKGGGKTVPRWMGGRMPLSTLLGQKVRARLEEALAGMYADAEMEAARGFLELQRKLSLIPAKNELLIERAKTRDGHHLYVYPFEGRLVHEGLSSLAAFRIARMKPASITAVCNDYGFELVSRKKLELTTDQLREVLSPEGLLEDLMECLNSTEMAKRQFRFIARVAGLISPGFPGQRRSDRQLMTSSNLLFDVFSKFDSENLLLRQARQEVLENQLEYSRLSQALLRIKQQQYQDIELGRLSPLAFGLWAESLREHVLSTEKWLDRVEEMIASMTA